MKTSNFQVRPLPALSQQQGFWKIKALFDRIPKGAITFIESVKQAHVAASMTDWAAAGEQSRDYGETEAGHLAMAGC
ncbi:MAG: hypothetical protein E5W38_11660 [Mesorhizobium sp.]|uniref:hypothetical protein n=1 Tax=unclassified Mesorhizobium TaxID=325217 RepID=UPI000F74D647|nr:MULTISPECIES: hypothetical protein [unclassified Mesorhizobium]AZO20017.1 hypothetical protein EJ070_04700 [Mesorhizobium sp. M1E.F.Ca.ET.045.02.1.1]RUW85268.1 hypothetical protein EOA29_05650 [Mesorhizobium sp. M1E.F.Ca.ET.063.01.1.1]TIU32743.1 MAG: hypothetical protein E5W38_11660 [Mesorhizobium sp.]